MQIFLHNTITRQPSKRSKITVKSLKTRYFSLDKAYNGVVTRIMNFGAFVEIAPGKEGLVHISRLDVKRTENVEDAVNVGDSIIVKCIEIDDQGRINLSRRDALIELEGMTPENDIDEAPKKPRRDNFRNDRRNRK